MYKSVDGLMQLRAAHIHELQIFFEGWTSTESRRACFHKLLVSEDDPDTLFRKVAKLWQTRRSKSARILKYICWTIQWRASCLKQSPTRATRACKETQSQRVRLQRQLAKLLTDVTTNRFCATQVFLYSVLHGWIFLFFMTVDPLMLRVLQLESTSAQLEKGGPEMLGMLRLNAVQDRDHGAEVSFPVQLCLVGALSISMLIRVTCMEICFFASVRVQNNVRSVLVHAIFRKSMCIPDHELDIGRISNLMATDADKIGKWSSLLFSLSQWSWTFLSLPFLVYFLYQLVGL